MECLIEPDVPTAFPFASSSRSASIVTVIVFGSQLGPSASASKLGQRFKYTRCTSVVEVSGGVASVAGANFLLGVVCWERAKMIRVYWLRRHGECPVGFWSDAASHPKAHKKKADRVFN